MSLVSPRILYALHFSAVLQLPEYPRTPRMVQGLLVWFRDNSYGSGTTHQAEGQSLLALSGPPLLPSTRPTVWFVTRPSPLDHCSKVAIDHNPPIPTSDSSCSQQGYELGNTQKAKSRFRSHVAYCSNYAVAAGTHASSAAVHNVEESCYKMAFALQRTL
jgi:hypothetical protein